MSWGHGENRCPVTISSAASCATSFTLIPYSFSLSKSDRSSPAESMKLSGLFIESERGYYDRFRSRIMFPVKNQAGNVIAFGGRIFDKEDDKAKYVNSPETPIYVKSNVLYGIDNKKWNNIN